MASQWRVSRCTVRQALDALVRDGIIERRQGKGTFVLPADTLRDFIGFYTVDGPEGQAIRFETRVLSFKPVDPPEKVRDYLRLLPGVEVLELRLLRLANETPAILLTAYMRAEVCSHLRAESFARTSVLTRVLTENGIPIVSQRRSVKPTVLAGEAATLLEVPPGSLGLHMERLSYAEFRQPIEYGVTLVRSDIVHYTLDIGRSDRSGARVLRHDPDGHQQHPDPTEATINS